MSGFISPPVASEFDATVGNANGRYATIQAAVSDSQTRLLVIEDTTETLDTAVPAGGLYIYIERGATIQMGTQQFTYAAAADVTIRGEGTLQWAATTTPNDLFDNSSFAASILDVKDITLDNNSTNNTNHLSSGVELLQNVRFEAPDDVNCGIRVATDGCHYSQLTIVGGGTSCERVITATGGNSPVFTDLTITGTFIASAAADPVINADGIFNNAVFSHDTAAIMILLDGAQMTNVRATAFDVDIDFTADGNTLINTNLLAGDIDTDTFDNNKLSNITTTGTIDLSAGGSGNNLIENSRITGAITIGGDRNKISNCDLLGGVTVSSGAVENIFIGCQVGADGGGGGNTITDNNGANDTIIVACQTDAAIAGTGTPVTAGNNVY
jgi:hypothetical protein